MTRRRGPVFVAAVGLAAMVSLVGCVQEVPLVSEPRTTSNDTLDEQLAWVEQQADAVIAAVEVADGWYWGGNGVPEIPWTGVNANRDPVRASLLPTSCGGSGAGRLYLALKNHVEINDPLLVANRVRARWESEGWVVTDVLPLAGSEQDFRADREDGALLGFTAATNGMVIIVYTSCSGHDTVTNWEMHLGSPNPFDEELDRRELSGEG